ncbi:glycosyltransferase family 4 protein [Rubrivirga litoralis]|uniref:Glycosyltransferase family 4 protein n=1 Tax=Rubrivirga litoralis TaxID=3075598 RepID=A0ABU3BQC9_9BACT|nr:glycosyltransferase family 4 protein [Rubrivirga sp. F394]MDT0631502.1 glycosyltransferase family 4 protein [Rubrivirga sp. F394]
MRVCFISRRFFPTISGMSVYALNLLRQLRDQGHDVVLVSQHYGGEAATVYGDGPPMEVPGIETIGMESVGEQTTGDFEADIEAIVRVVEQKHREKPFDVIHAQYAYPTGLAALEASRRTGAPNVVSIQGGDGHWVGECCGTHREAMHAVLDHAGAVLIGSDSFAREVHGRLGTDLARFTIVPGAVNVERFRPRPAPAVGGVADEAAPVLLYHGRVDRRKGVLDLLDAVRLLRDRGRAVRLAVSGIGPDVDAVRERVDALGLGGAVDVLGIASYEEAPARYHLGDVFVSPTYMEGFSNTILEAMASGLPIVSCEVVGVVDCLQDDRDALLVAPEAPEQLAAAVERLLDDAPLRERLAQTALDEARTLYSWRARGEQIAGVYRSLQGTAPDNGWTYDGSDPDPCVYRETPQLL